MKHLQLLFPIVLALAKTAAAMDFTPQYAESVQDGFPTQRLYFADEKQRVYLAVPQDWSVAGNGQRGTFTPANLPQASVILYNSPLQPVAAFDEKGLEIYRKLAATLVPKGATDIEPAVEKINDVQLNGWSSFEVICSYQFFGQNLTKSMLFLTLGKDKQICMKVEARKEHFEKVYPRARGILGSWFSPTPEFEAALARLTARQ